MARRLVAGSSVGRTRMRASRAITPNSSASSGLMSSSITSADVDDQLRDLDQRQRDIVQRRARVSPGTPGAGCDTRVRDITSRARCMLSGGSASAVSSTTSTDVPPWPNKITGPNCWSSRTPTISSKRVRPLHHRLDREAVHPGVRHLLRSHAGASPRRPRARPPACCRSSDYPAHVRFVGDIARQDLQSHRPGHLGGLSAAS